MGKGGKRSSQGSTSINGGNGGILGSGIFGNIGTNIVCKAEDSGFYCGFMKFMNFLLMEILLLGLLYVAYIFFSGKAMSGGSLMKSAYDSIRKNRV
jgi:hypothetical protein